MTIELAHDVGPARLTIAYERLGDPHVTPDLAARIAAHVERAERRTVAGESS